MSVATSTEIILTTTNIPTITSPGNGYLYRQSAIMIVGIN
jgi:hypothetical protein